MKPVKKEIHKFYYKYSAITAHYSLYEHVYD